MTAQEQSSYLTTCKFRCTAPNLRMYYKHMLPLVPSVHNTMMSILSRFITHATCPVPPVGGCSLGLFEIVRGLRNPTSQLVFPVCRIICGDQPTKRDT
jgi:hypothetical protein